MLEQSDVLRRYDYMSKLSRSRWAWEIQRRVPEFRCDAQSRPADDVSWKRIPCFDIRIGKARNDQSLARKWGLAFFPNPDQNGCEADAMWLDERFPRKLMVHVVPRAPGEEDEIFDQSTKHAAIRHFTHGDGREQLLLKGNGYVLQVRCRGLSLLSKSPVKMHLVFDGLDLMGDRYKLLEEKARLITKPFPLPKDTLWTRASLALRDAVVCVDCHALGLDTFETAAVLFGYDHARKAWDGPGDAMRQKVIRSLRRGRELLAGGYRDLLKGTV